MSLTLPANLIIEKNKISSANPWLILLDITLPDNTVLYLVKNNEDITFNGQTYIAIPFELEPPQVTSKGEIPSASLKICNISKALQSFLEAYDGGVGVTILLRVVNYAYLNENYAELEMTFDVLSSTADAYWVTFSLGAPNLLRYRFPKYRVLANHCNWKFMSTALTDSAKARECNWKDSRKKWTNSTAYTKDTAITPTVDNNCTYKCIVGGTTGSTEPTWPTEGADTVIDGTVTWQRTGATDGCNKTLEDCRRLANSERFGGFPGLSHIGVRLV